MCIPLYYYFICRFIQIFLPAWLSSTFDEIYNGKWSRLDRMGDQAKFRKKKAKVKPNNAVRTGAALIHSSTNTNDDDSVVVV